MITKAKLRADLLGAGEGLFWLSIGWGTVWCLFRVPPIFCLIPLSVACLGFGLCFMHRPSAIAFGRFRARASRTTMWWHVLVIPMLLTPAIWTALESLVGDIEEHRYKLVLMVSLSTAGWAFLILSSLFKLAFQSLRYNRKTTA